MAEKEELLKDIKLLLVELSDKFQKLSKEITGDGSSKAAAVESVEAGEDEPEYIGGFDDTQSLEPPPLEEEAVNLDEETKALHVSSDSGEYKTSEMEAVKDDSTERLEPEEETLEPPAEETGAIPLLKKLGRLEEIVKKKGLEVSKKDFAFIPKSTEVYASLGESDRIGAKGGRILLDCINFLDSIEYKYPGQYYSALREAVGAMIRSLAEFLNREVGYTVFPLKEESRSVLNDILPDYSTAVQERRAFSPEKEGKFISVRRRGAVLENDVVRKAQLLVASGEENEVGSALDASIEAVTSLKSKSERGADMKLKAISSLIEWREKLYGSDEDHRLTVARYALNLLHTLESPAGDKAGGHFPEEQSKKLKKVIGSLISLLRAGGLSEILVSVGGKFDESYDPSKYERKKVSSEKSAGTIVGVLRRGFLDKNGIPVQKAVIAVSGS